MVLGLALAAAACMQAPVEDAVAPVEPARARVAPPPVQPAVPVAQGVAWSDSAQPTGVPEFQGKPLTLPAGAHCRTFRDLPSTTYTTSTLVKDACLRIPSGTVVTVRGGATLAIVATTGLFIGKGVVLDAAGSRGRRGDRSQFATIDYRPASDSEVQALCVEQGNRCACPSSEASLAAIRGRTGAAGTPGGTIQLIAGELRSPSRLAGLAIDVSGGPGGPPGDSGRQECSRGEIHCLSAVCDEGAGSGANGPPGAIVVAMGGAVAGAASGQVKALRGATRPGDSIALGAGANVSARIAELDAEAIQKGWQRRSGEEPY